ncbi:protein kinase domain-containing protein [Coleofasciculus sp. E1-EBD-02]|uniref:protein kinase domain-containing protein n=1 Tax=Coleofasciculus sp. E1-EBD-02 TaxID=3068481 RepID=UPI0032FCF18D
MSLCINPKCQNPDNPDNLLYCQSCQSELLLEGRYRVISLLGEGGFAKTYEVSDRTTIPKVIKVLSKNEPKPVEQFQREAQVLTRLHHPGVPKAEESFTFYPNNSQEPVYCLVMEKIEGENLEKWLENRGNRPIGEKLAVDWLTQLANTLHEVHKNQLFHRDIKPSNIMIKPEGGLVLIDFGIAREITGTYEQKQAAGQVTKVVSDGYSPLEQVIGSAAPQSDFFALGRTFVHLLTGEHPLNLGDPYRHDIYTDELEDWRDKAPQISSLLGDFIDQLMARPIQKRPADTQSILAQLAEIDQTLYPRKLSNTTSSQVVHTPNKQNIVLERTIGDNWYSDSFESVHCLAMSPDGEILVSGNGNAIKAWNMNNGTEIYTVTEHRNSVLSLAISLDGQYLVSGGDDSSIKVCKLSTGELIRTFEDNHGSVYSIAITPDGQKLISGSYGGFTTLWNLNTGEEIRTIFKHTKSRHYTKSVRCVAVSPDGKTIVSGDLSGVIESFPRCSFRGHSGYISSVVITLDGERLISSSSDKTIKIWSLTTGDKIDTLTGHTGAVTSLAVSPSGDLLVSGSEDKTIKLWNLNTRKEVNTITGHLNEVTDVVFSPDGQFFVSGSKDCTIKVWRIQ